MVQPRRGGFTEIVEKTGGGLLVEPDDPESLAEGLLRIYRDPELRRTLGPKWFRKSSRTLQRGAAWPTARLRFMKSYLPRIL